MEGKTELLAPAGNAAKLRTALYFGADAAYIGGKEFSLRTYTDNFTVPEIPEAVNYAHSLGKKIYAAVNVYARNEDFGRLGDYFRFLSDAGVDAVIISDCGVFAEARRAAPGLPVHISTQANLTNREAVRFWYEQGACRAVLARELSVDEIAEIHACVPGMELEAFVHGAMCISYSGRCLLSDYLSDRESNRGECVQCCRWQYSVRKKDPLGDTGWMDLVEDGRGTYIFNSKDLNMAAHLDDLRRAGVSSFKIEGRVKGEYYLATVIGAYRRCMDRGYDADVERELDGAAHRSYTCAYAYGENPDTVNYDDSESAGSCDYIGNITGYSDGVAYVEMRGRFSRGDVLEVMSPGKSHGRSFVFETATLPDGTETDDCKLVQCVYGVPCPYELSPGDMLRRRKA